VAVLQAYGREVNSVFQLLGEKENDLTMSMSWALSRCPVFLEAVVLKITGLAPVADEIVIKNQVYDPALGITDIEISDGRNFHIIIEAKRGWILPSANQLTMYSVRMKNPQRLIPNRHIVTLSECSQKYAQLYLPFTSCNGIPVSHLSWKEVFDFAEQSRAASNHEQKHLLAEFSDYLKGVMTMQKKDSNMVYVVALGTDKPNKCDISWIDIVLRHNRYFCPVGGNGWPKEPPNYIAFRYYGQLQSIHHIEGYTVSRNMHDEIPEMPDEVWDTDCYIYKLGPAIKPQKTVKTGKIYRSGRVWAMLDTLLTSDSISDARDLTQERMK